MVRPLQIHLGETFSSPILLALGMLVSVTLIVSLCAKHARRIPSKYAPPKTIEPETPKSPLKSPKQLITTISQKVMMPLIHGKNSGQREASGAGDDVEEESGLWQKAILMGDRCQPPEFPGVIYYDYSGNRIPEMPKSPRAGSMSPFRNFTFRLEKDQNSV